MDFKKLQKLVDKQITLDIDNADEHELRACYKLGDNEHWLEFTPEKYESEEEFAAVINTDFERKLHGKIKTVVE